MNPEVCSELIGGKPVYIVEDHHHALIPWRKIQQRLGQSFHVLTLDHHTDTLPAFSHFNEVFHAEHPLDVSVEDALDDMRHDEHFDFATQTGLITSAVIFSHVNFSIHTNPALTVVHDKPEDESIAALGSYYGRALESNFLRKNLSCAPIPEHLPYVLDIDLDYFKGERSVTPDDPAVFLDLIRGSAAITICRERDWVRILNLDYGKLQYEFFLNKVLEMIRTALR